MRQRRSLQNARYIGWHNLKVFVLSQQDPNLFYTAVPNSRTVNGSPEASEYALLALFAFLTILYKRLASSKGIPISWINMAEFSILALHGFLRIAGSGAVSRFSFERLDEHFEGCGALFTVAQRLARSWFDFGVSRLLAKLVVEPNSSLIANSLVY